MKVLRKDDFRMVCKLHTKNKIRVEDFRKSQLEILKQMNIKMKEDQQKKEALMSQQQENTKTSRQKKITVQFKPAIDCEIESHME